VVRFWAPFAGRSKRKSWCTDKECWIKHNSKRLDVSSAEASGMCALSELAGCVMYAGCAVCMQAVHRAGGQGQRASSRDGNTFRFFRSIHQIQRRNELKTTRHQKLDGVSWGSFSKSGEQKKRFDMTSTVAHEGSGHFPPSPTRAGLSSASTLCTHDQKGSQPHST
jgi:hypothetical protein